MTQMDFADRLNVSFQAVSNWERGISMPDITKLPEIAKFLNISIDDLLDGESITLCQSSTAQAVSEVISNNWDEFCSKQQYQVKKWQIS